MLLFLYPTVIGGLADSPLTLAGYTTENSWHAVRGRSLPSFTVAYALAIGADEISVQLQKNGADVGPPAVLSTSQHMVTVPLNSSVIPGDRISMLLTSGVTLNPVNQPLVAVIP